MANVLDSIEEPSKWVCHLTCNFDSDERLVYGTGFLVNIPDTHMYCIMTAGHNIKRPEGGYATSIGVKFPNSLTLTAKPGQYFVSEIYHKHTTLKDTDEGSISDYGLITVKRDRVDPPLPLDLHGCAFSVLFPRYELTERDCTVYGYKEGSPRQTKNTSQFTRVLEKTLDYDKETTGGVSGGPVFICHNGSDIAIGIHNYNKRATQLTFPVILEMLSWIEDYGLERKITMLDKKNSISLCTTNGVEPKIVARAVGKTWKLRNTVTQTYGVDHASKFRFVVVSAAKEEEVEKKDFFGHHRFAIILPKEYQPRNGKPYYFLGVDEDEGAVFRADDSPSKECVFRLPRKGIKSGNKFLTATLALDSPNECISLAVQKLKRLACQCGCISQDAKVRFQEMGDAFSPDPKFKGLPSMDKKEGS